MFYIQIQGDAKEVERAKKLMADAISSLEEAKSTAEAARSAEVCFLMSYS